MRDAFGAHLYMYNADDFASIILDRYATLPNVLGVATWFTLLLITKKNTALDLSPYI